MPSRLPKYAAIGLDLSIDTRIELDLVFVTPEGHLSGPFARFFKQVRRMADPGFEPHDRAPLVGHAGELTTILEQCFALYDGIANTLKDDTWWDLTPKPWLDERPRVAA